MEERLRDIGRRNEKLDPEFCLAFRLGPKEEERGTVRRGGISVCPHGALEHDLSSF